MIFSLEYSELKSSCHILECMNCLGSKLVPILKAIENDNLNSTKRKDLKTIFGVNKFWGQTKLLVNKILGSNKIFGSNKFLG